MSDQTIQLMHGDSRVLLATLPENYVDSVVTDPPYMIGFMGKAFDNPKNNIAADPVFWAEVLRVLKPGGHLLSFGGTRTQHRMVCAIEDAGFEIRDQLQWLYATGFPKTKNALKPANEPICLARKPLSETSVAANALRWGTGGINIAGSKVGTETVRTTARNDSIHKKSNSMDDKWSGEINTECRQGRWPANVILSPEAAEELDRQSGQLTSGARKNSSLLKTSNPSFAQNTPGGYGYKAVTFCEASSGGASRFFYVAKPSQAERNAGCENLKPGTLRINAPRACEDDNLSSSQARHNPHPTIKPMELLSYLVRLITPPGGIVLDPFAGSFSTGMAAVNGNFGFIGIEQEDEYFQVGQARMKHAQALTGLFA